jgi:hypothetical protein
MSQHRLFSTSVLPLHARDHFSLLRRTSLHLALIGFHRVTTLVYPSRSLSPESAETTATTQPAARNSCAACVRPLFPGHHISEKAYKAQQLFPAKGSPLRCHLPLKCGKWRLHPSTVYVLGPRNTRHFASSSRASRTCGQVYSCSPSFTPHGHGVSRAYSSSARTDASDYGSTDIEALEAELAAQEEAGF